MSVTTMAEEAELREFFATMGDDRLERYGCAALIVTTTIHTEPLLLEVAGEYLSNRRLLELDRVQYDYERKSPDWSAEKELEALYRERDETP